MRDKSKKMKQNSPSGPLFSTTCWPRASPHILSSSKGKSIDTLETSALTEKDKLNRSPAHLAALVRNKEALKFLFQKINFDHWLYDFDDLGFSPIDYTGYKDMIQKRLSEEEHDRQFSKWVTFLHHMLAKDLPAHSLILKGKSIDTLETSALTEKDKLNRSPAHLAALVRNEGALKFLTRNPSVDWINVIDYLGFCALDYITSNQ